MLLTVLAAGTVVLALVFGSQLAGGSAQARPPVQQPVSSGVTIPYPGRLADAAGQPVLDGAYDFTFTLYSTESGGTPLWSEVQTGVAVQGGAFHAQLGSVQSIPPAALNGGERWLVVSVRGPNETGFTALAPRQELSVGASTAPASPSAGLACPHDHFGEWWSGDPGTGNNGLRVESTRTNSNGITGVAHNGVDAMGVFGWTTQGVGVRGSSDSSTGVYGTGAVGVHGVGTTIGVHGIGDWGVYGESDSYAGVFAGDVNILGTLTKFGGSFKIDHPLDPANKYLYHSFVESPDMKNVYDGVVTLDANGEAVVMLPDWFGALNRDFRYQLTCIGGFAPVYIAEEIRDNQFKIAGGNAGLKVSWQVTGIRQDPYAEQHRIPVEEDKPPEERGAYLYPEGYGLPATMRINLPSQPLEETQP